MLLGKIWIFVLLQRPNLSWKPPLRPSNIKQSSFLLTLCQSRSIFRSEWRRLRLIDSDACYRGDDVMGATVFHRARPRQEAGWRKRAEPAWLLNYTKWAFRHSVGGSLVDEDSNVKLLLPSCQNAKRLTSFKDKRLKAANSRSEKAPSPPSFLTHSENHWRFFAVLSQQNYEQPFFCLAQCLWRPLSS